MNDIKHFTVQKDKEGLVDFYSLAPGITLSFNQIHSSGWSKGDSSIFSEQMLVLNFCINGRCDATLDQNQSAIVSDGQVCVSTILPVRDFYYPGRLYEGIQFYLDRILLKQAMGTDFLSQMGISVEQLTKSFCGKNGLYINPMSAELHDAVFKMWNLKETATTGQLRYYMVRLLHELTELPTETNTNTYFSKSQIAIVKEAEAMILQDLSKRITAKEMAAHFGISESSFKQYVKGILGDTYLSYFRKKRMEKAAELLQSTKLKIIEISNAVGYENQGKFAKIFAETYGVTPLEFRRLSR